MLIGWLLSTRMGRALSAAAVAVAAFLGVWIAGRREGRSLARSEALEEDYENAQDIRNRVERGLDERLREQDDAGVGYRD